MNTGSWWSGTCLLPFPPSLLVPGRSREMSIFSRKSGEAQQGQAFDKTTCAGRPRSMRPIHLNACARRERDTHTHTHTHTHTPARAHALQTPYQRVQAERERERETHTGCRIHRMETHTHTHTHLTQLLAYSLSGAWYSTGQVTALMRLVSSAYSLAYHIYTSPAAVISFGGASRSPSWLPLLQWRAWLRCLPYSCSLAHHGLAMQEGRRGCRPKGHLSNRCEANRKVCINHTTTHRRQRIVAVLAVGAGVPEYISLFVPCHTAVLSFPGSPKKWDMLHYDKYLIPS